MQAVGAGYFIVQIIIIVAVILLFLMPFFIYKIRNQVVEINHKLSRVVAALEGRSLEEVENQVRNPLDYNKPIVKCAKCRKNNRAGDTHCVNCGAILVPSA